MDDEKLFEQFYQRLSIGLPGVESGGGDYNAQNSQGSAAGKYQFTKQWLTGRDSIQEYAKSTNVFEVPQTMEDFKANPQLQEAYFKHYSKKVLYPKAKEIIKGKNPLDLSLDQVGALLHFDGESNAKKQIVSGTLKKATKKGVNGAKYDNVSGAGYLNKYNKTLGQYKLEPISKALTSDDKTKQQIIDSFNQRNADIDKLDMDPGAKESLRAKLYQEITDAGNKDIINEYIEKENVANQEKYNSARNLETVLANAQKSSFSATGNISFEIGDKNPGDVEKAIKDYPELFKGAIIKDDKKTPLNPWAASFGGGKKVKTIHITQHNAKAFSQKLFDLNNKGEINLVEDKTTGNNLYDITSSLIPDKLKSGAIADSKSTLVKGQSKVSPPTKRLPINNKRNVVIPEPKEEENGNVPEKKEEEKKGTIPKEDGQKDSDPTSTAADDYFNTALGLGALNDDSLNYQPGKKEIPIDAIVGMSLGLIGNEQAKNAKIPLRTEEVSEAMRNYTAELMNRSKEGLPVEVEAAMKNQLADAYQGGLANIVNASGGNTATVLGNLGSLESSKNKGLVAIQIADYEAKDRAFQQYGKAIEYINDFDARRDIANHGIKYNEAKMKQQQGQQLATAGFAKLIDAIKYDKENGPGSANDMYRSLLMQKMFGFDPKMKDDGSGEVTGTKSWYDKNKALTQKDFETTKELHQKYGSLNPEQKQVFSKVLEQTQDKEKLGGLVDYFSQNPDMDVNKMSVNNLDLALEKDDFSLLSKNRKEILNPSTSVLPTEGLATAPSTLPNTHQQMQSRTGLAEQATSEIQPKGLAMDLSLPQLDLEPLTLNK